jgi:hypothetical protein
LIVQKSGTAKREEVELLAERKKQVAARQVRAKAQAESAWDE